MVIPEEPSEEFTSSIATIRFDTIPVTERRNSLEFLTRQSLQGRYRGKQEIKYCSDALRPKSNVFDTNRGFESETEEPNVRVAHAAVGRYRATKGIEETTSNIIQTDQILQLEKLLSIAYKIRAEITSIKCMRKTAKDVKEVRFLDLDKKLLHKIWVFKADPVETAKELTAYHIAYSNGVPTAKPIGFDPQKTSQVYPYDIAMLGGAVVEHAGNSYADLIKDLQRKPKYIHDVARSVAAMLADTNVRLTKALDQFSEYGYKLERQLPSKRLEFRMLPTLAIQASEAGILLKICDELYQRQSSHLLVCHCDVTTGNIVTRKADEGTSITDFGLIDWGCIGLDNPYSDLIDFWVHHRRIALENCDYPFDINGVEEAYVEQFNIRAAELGLGVRASAKDKYIQTMLWHLYELFDPFRNGSDRIEKLARHHCQGLCNALLILEKQGFSGEARQIRQELSRVLVKVPYLNDILNS